MLRTLLATISGIAMLASIGCLDASEVLLVNDTYKDSSKQFYSALRQQMTQSNIEVHELGPEQLAAELDKTESKGNILLLPNAVSFPADAKEPLLKFLRRGNHLLALSGPAFSQMMLNANGQWVTKEGLNDILADSDGNIIFDFSKVDISQWTRSSGSMQNAAEHIVEPPSSEHPSAALHMKISKLDNWDTFVSPALVNPFRNGQTVTTFSAKGGPNTTELLIEWREKDGSRWMSSVKLTQEWKKYALTPADFHFWADGSPANRGGAGDMFKPENASIFTVGLSNSLTSIKLGIPHEYWISDVKAVKNPYSDIDYGQPILESISPQYKIYPVHDCTVRSADGGSSLANVDIAYASIQRPFGIGSDSVRKMRQIPLLYAYDKDGGNRGIVGHLFLNTLGNYSGSIWGYIGIPQNDLERNAQTIIPCVISMIERMNRGLFLSNAGSDHFAYADGERTIAGAYVLDLTGKQADVQLKTSIIANGKVVSEAVVSGTAPAGNRPTGIFTNSEQLDPGLYTIKSILISNGIEIDNVSHEFQVIRYGKLTKQNTVVLASPDFMLNGRKWYPFGMNYWPRYSIGLEPGDYWLHWLTPDQYDPAMIESDLSLAKSLGMNMLSIQYGKIDQARPLMDLLSRAEKHGIKLHIFLPTTHPLWPDLEQAKAMIKAAHLQESPAVWAYDLGWEVNVGQYNARRNFDKDWQQWVIDRYGSIENAKNDWKYDAPIVDGVLTGPSDQQLINDGEWRIYVAAYRLFWDDRISFGYRKVREAIRSVDKVHLMGARSGYGGTGAIWIADHLPFDLLSGAKHLDFVSPEAYNIGGDRKGFLKGGFHVAYGRHFSGGKPIYWAEYGSPLFVGMDPQNYKNEYTDEQYERERAYYEGMIRMTIDTYSNGSGGWWWPGGLRVDERSDFGIINPDGTPRPAALEFKKAAAEYHAPRDVPSPNVFIDIDRDKYVSGYAGVFEEGSRKYIDLFDSGRFPGVRTGGTGTTSANVPLTAVGNVPYNGNNPLKFINAEFNWIKINGKVISNGETIIVKKNDPIVVEASIGNTAEAKWLAPSTSSIGGVFLVAKWEGQSKEIPIRADTEFLGDASVLKTTLKKHALDKATFTFRMRAKDRADFGEVMRITIDPR